jgi:hypothetical protein
MSILIHSSRRQHQHHQRRLGGSRFSIALNAAPRIAFLPCWPRGNWRKRGRHCTRQQQETDMNLHCKRSSTSMLRWLWNGRLRSTNKHKACCTCEFSVCFGWNPAVVPDVDPTSPSVVFTSQPHLVRPDPWFVFVVKCDRRWLPAVRIAAECLWLVTSRKESRCVSQCLLAPCSP